MRRFIEFVTGGPICETFEAFCLRWEGEGGLVPPAEFLDGGGGRSLPDAILVGLPALPATFTRDPIGGEGGTP